MLRPRIQLRNAPISNCAGFRRIGKLTKPTRPRRAQLARGRIDAVDSEIAVRRNVPYPALDAAILLAGVLGLTPGLWQLRTIRLGPHQPWHGNRGDAFTLIETAEAL